MYLGYRERRPTTGYASERTEQRPTCRRRPSYAPFLNLVAEMDDPKDDDDRMLRAIERVRALPAILLVVAVIAGIAAVLLWVGIAK